METLMKADNDTIQREFGGLPVVDAKYDVRLFVAQEDIDYAKTKDPGHCIFANSCKRQFDANKVLFLRGRAYVPLPNEDGKMRVERFILPSQTKRLIKRFDEGEKIEPGGAFRLLAPSKSQTLKAERESSRKAREKSKDPKYKNVKQPQQGSVAKPFLKDPSLQLSAREIHEEYDFDWPLTSTRRSLKNLEDAGVLLRTDNRVRTDISSTGEYQYRIAPISKTTRDSLLETIEHKRRSIKAAKMYNAKIRNGTGVVQSKMKKNQV